MRRIPELDALRGISALVIVLSHGGWLQGSPWELAAVDMFFVLSGYFITTNILKNRDSQGFLRVFFLRRALRIWPAYYVALAACLMLNRSLAWDAKCDAWPQYLTFTQNLQLYWKRPLPSFSGMFLHSWTLAIEEQFYIIWPLLLCRAGRKTLVAILTLFLVAPTCFRMLDYQPYALLTRGDGLAFGSILAWLVFDRELVARRLRTFRAAFAAAALASLLTALLVNVPPALFTTRACLLFFGLGGLVLCLQEHKALALLRDRRLCYVGTISYGLYLYHPLVFAALPGPYKRLVFRKLGLTNSLLMNVVLLAVCFLLAELSRRFLEEPILALKERWTYKTAGVDPAAYGVLTAYRGPHANLEASVKV